MYIISLLFHHAFHIYTTRYQELKLQSSSPSGLASFRPNLRLPSQRPHPPLHLQTPRSGNLATRIPPAHALLPGLFSMPVALGLFGASLQYHLHYIVLALACFLGGWTTNSIIPVTLHYIIECFKGHTSESAAIMVLYRLAFTLKIPFIVPDWIVKVGSGWCLGMAAFFSIFAFGFIVVLMIWGEQVRETSWGG